MAFYRQWQAIVSQGTFVLAVAVSGAAILGLSGLWLVERELIARAGESLAIGAVEVADRLDATFQERTGDLEILATASQVRGSNPVAVSAYLETVQRAYPVYSRLVVTNRAGKVVAATDREMIGRDFEQSPWYQAVLHQSQGYAGMVREKERRGGELLTVVFSSPIKAADGAFLGAIMTEVDRALVQGTVEKTVRQFAAQTKNFGRVDYRVLTSDGALLLNSDEGERDPGNFLELGLSSANNIETGQSGYAEEEHLVRHVPVVTGYARLKGSLSSRSLQWGILVGSDRDGVVAHIRSRLVPVGLVGLGGFILMFGVSLWANQRQQREQKTSAAALRALAESEARTRTVLQDAMDAVVVMDAQGIISGWNTQAEAIFGWEMVEVLGRSLVATIVPPQYRDAHRQGVARYLSTGEATVLNKRIEISALRKDGTEFPIELTITPLKLERGIVFSAFVRDISDRKRMLDRLRESETFFRLLSEQLPVGVFEIDEQGACVYGNKMWRSLFNLSEEAGTCHQVRSGSWLQWFHPDDREKVEEEWELARTAFDRVAVECRLAEGGEEARWVNVLLWPMTTEEGVRYLGTLEDITERKRTVAHTMTLLRHGRFELQTLTEARNLAELLAHAFPDPSRTQLGLTELFVNGVEHGNLGISYAEKSALLDQGQFEVELVRRLALPEHMNQRVHITVERTDRNLELTILDDGSGFDWKQYLDLNRERADDLHGRGIAMAKLISFDEVEFRGCGNQVVVSVSLKASDGDAWPEEERKVA